MHKSKDNAKTDGHWATVSRASSTTMIAKGTTMIVVLLLFVAASPPPAPSSVLMPTSQRTLHIKSRLVSGGTGCIQLIYKIPSSSHLPSIPFLSLSSSRYHFLPSAFPSPTGESKVRPEGITKRLVSSQTRNVHVMSWEGEIHAHTCVRVCTVSCNHTSVYARLSRLSAGQTIV